MQVGNFDKSKLKSKSKMAIYHFSVKTISRSNGRSAVACAAYRSGEKLVCNFYGKEQDYTKKKLVLNSQKSMPQIIQILSYSTVRHFGTK